MGGEFFYCSEKLRLSKSQKKYFYSVK